MSFDGWIECGEHQPPEGMGFDVRRDDGGVFLVEQCQLERIWDCRVELGHHWRPSAEQGWQRNDGTEPDCEFVDIVFGDGDSRFNTPRLGYRWNDVDNAWCDIVYWRPHQEPASTPKAAAKSVTLPAFKHIDDVLPWMEYVHDKPATKSVAIKCDGLLLDSKKSVKEVLHRQGFATCEVMIGRAEVLAGALFQ